MIASVESARRIWQAGVDAVNPRNLFAGLLHYRDPFSTSMVQAGRILVVGAGKAGAAMAEALEEQAHSHLEKIEGIVSVPEDCVRPLKKIQLRGGRPAGSNHPTAAGVEASEEMLKLLASAGPDDVGVCLLSGGGSALLPAPAEGISLEEKQQITKQLHACGATINEMNMVRKHLSRIKGGRLIQAFTGKEFHSLIISDVVGDPLDVIASGPTVPDPTTFSDALSVLEKYGLHPPANILEHLKKGQRGEIPETLKMLSPQNNFTRIIGNNWLALEAAVREAEAQGWPIRNLGSLIVGDTTRVATDFATLVRMIRNDQFPVKPPVCILSGGETTVNLGPHPGTGGRNQEFVLAMLHQLGDDMKGVTILSGGTDGEDGPTDAAGAIATEETLKKAREMGLSPEEYLNRHDAWHFFDQVGGLLKTGLTETNVMDVRVILISE